LSDDVRLAVLPAGGHYFVGQKAAEVARVVREIVARTADRATIQGGTR
jgi:surfactin synthase thioesterase subunit